MARSRGDSSPRGQAQWVGYWLSQGIPVSALEVSFRSKFPDATEGELETAFDAGQMAQTEAYLLSLAAPGTSIGEAMGLGTGGQPIRVRALYRRDTGVGGPEAHLSVVHEFQPWWTMEEVSAFLGELAADEAEGYGEDKPSFAGFLPTVQ